MMIYIVEDDKNIQEIESFALKNSGYEVRGFEYAKDFYAALDEQIRIWCCWILCCRMKMVFRF